MRNKKSVLMTLNHNCGCFSGVAGIAGNYSITETQNRNWLSWVIIGDIFNNPELIA